MRENRRYLHPYAKVKDIMNQKKILSTIINQHSKYSTIGNKEKIAITN
jgi:hypothetical protein